MAEYDSDSSGADDVQTSVLLGYASKEPTGDDFSQLGGHPTWLDDLCTPNGALAKCRVCNGYMSLLLQLNADIPDRFPGHERRIYVWACRRKACRRKNESVRVFRATRGTLADKKPTAIEKEQSTTATDNHDANTAPTPNLGETLFGVKSPSIPAANPFATSASSSNDMSNPFTKASSASQASSTTTVDTLPETFAQKARISSGPIPSVSVPRQPQEPWPDQSVFPAPFPHYQIDAESEYLDSDPMEIPSNARVGGGTLESEGSNSGLDEKSLFESSMDKTFQRFADRLAQNPQQILRYEYGGHALLYTKKDAVGKLLSADQESSNAKVRVSSGGGSSASSRMPRCANCGAGRVFELQLTPHAILELEAEDMSIDGMDWGTIVVGVCSADCQEKDIESGKVGYLEEWVGVQWEELAGKGR
nr:putative 20s rrna accumulation protein 4 [Quercus suber]